MKEFTPASHENQDDDPIERAIQHKVDTRGISWADARAEVEGEYASRQASIAQHPSNYQSPRNDTPIPQRRSNRGPNFGEEDSSPIYYQTGDTTLDPAQVLTNEQGAAAVRAILRAQRTEPVSSHQIALDRARDERRWNKA